MMTQMAMTLEVLMIKSVGVCAYWSKSVNADRNGPAASIGQKPPLSGKTSKWNINQTAA